MKFHIKYGNGSEETVVAEHTTEEAFIAAKWGMPEVFGAFLEGGGALSVVEEVPADPPVADPV